MESTFSTAEVSEVFNHHLTAAGLLREDLEATHSLTPTFSDLAFA